MTPYIFRILKLNRPGWIKYLLSHPYPWSTYVVSSLITGTSVSLTKSIRRPLLEFFLQGNTYQFTTTGKNKADMSLLPITNSGITISQNENGDIVLNGTPDYDSGYVSFIVGTYVKLPAGSYTTSVQNKKIGIGFSVGSFDGELNLVMGDTIKTKSATSSQENYIRPVINIRYDVGTLTNYVLNPMLEQGLTATSYEPYTGGIASPNPDFPQDINSVGDNGSITIVKTNENSTLSKTYTIPVQQPMRKIGDIADDFVKQAGVWYERHRITQIVLNGTEDWTRFTNVNYEYQLSLFDGLTTDGSNEYFPALCDKYVNNNVSGASLENYQFSHFSTMPVSKKERFVRFRNNGITSLEAWKTELSTNNLIVYVPLAEPTLLPCTSGQTRVLEEIIADGTYAGQTNYSSDSVSPIINVKYWKESN